MSNAVAIQIQMLSLIPASPDKIEASKIEARLHAMGYEIGRRTIERHLVKLALQGGFAIVRDGSKPAGWSWKAGTRAIRFPGMDAGTALTMALVGRYLAPILPFEMSRLLAPEFEQARGKLDALPNAPFTRWSHRIAVLPPEFPLMPPKVDSNVREVVYDALLKGLKFEADYCNPTADEPARHTFNPLGLVYRDSVLYLVATVRTYKELRQFALQRMSAPELLKTPSSEVEGFDLDRYIREERQFEFPQGPPIEVELRVSDWLINHLRERHLSESQTIVPIRGSEDCRVTALVHDTLPLQWWLLSLGSYVEVLKPLSLRRKIARETRAVGKKYQAGVSKRKASRGVGAR